VKGPIFTVQKVLPLLRDGASIMLNSSVIGSKGLPRNSVYTATKAAVRSFARSNHLRAAHSRDAISPGARLSDLLASPETGEQYKK
jgi:NAD(P)-dependent dehydrogenase (short-subunit alcohol dehydrogenase family)